MVSAALVECVVRDCTNNAGNERLEFTLPASTTVHDFVCQVAEKMNYEPQSIQLTMLDDDSKVYTEKTTGSLESVGFSTETNQRNSLILEGIRGNSKNLVIKYLPGYPSSSEDSAVASPPPLDQFPGYVGLVNQAMTCYLNSLLQALYMTPEFRNALYKWQFDVSHGNEIKCIPFQLQKLFLSLQRSSKNSIETTELTRSFGWESGEVWQQHDIQELCRVMFDALEHEFKETQQADLINRLYQGKMIDYVKCLECGLEKSREDTFLDIPLPVRPFGSTIAYGSIEEALRAFVQPETLDGNNQYFCEACNKKCDAHKGLKFSKFPYLLTLHLKRFDFDYSTMHRIKLNDKVVFPEILDLNNFVSCNNSVEEITGEGQDSIVRNDDSSTADSALDEEVQQHTTQVAEPQNNEVDQDEDEGIDLSSNSGNHENDKNRQNNSSPLGPFVYELYSIMIHSGSASGGHYYAYIKDFKKGNWFCFNDQSVTRLTHEDIKKTYGGGPARGYYSGAYSSSTNAYMLMYRQMDKELNCFAMTEDEFPPHMMKLLEDLREAEEKEKALKARQEEMIRIKVHTCPVNGSPRSNKIYCYSDSTLAEVKSMAYQYLKLEGIVPEEQCRLVSYNKSQDVLEESFDGKEKETISEMLFSFSSLRHTTNFDLFLEIREKDKLFLPYNIGDINMTVYLIDVEKEEVESVSQIRTSPCQTVPDLKNVLKMAIPLKSVDLHLVLLVGHNTLSYINDNTLPLNKLGFSSLNRVFICYQTPGEDISQTFTSTKLYNVLDEVKNIVTLHLSLPDSCEATLELLLIPPLVEEIEIEKASDPTPSAAAGDSKVPITKWLEEEAGFAGCTSDQSTSEDSSLADSERTIIGEVVNEKEAPGSSPSDSDQQLSSPENQTPARICCQMNWGVDEENWDVENVIVNINFYYKASPYTADDGQKMLRVVADRNMDVVQLKRKLEKYVGVAAKYMKLTRGVDGDEVCGYLKDCKDEERVCVKLQRVLSEGEHRIRVNHLAPNAPTPIQYMFDWIVCNGMTIENLKKVLLKETEKRAGLKIPYERCRLRRQNWKSPGEVLLDWDRWEEPASLHKTELYLQQLEEGGPDPVTSSKQLLLFTRRWHPSTLRLGPFIELVLEAPSPSNLLNELANISGIPIEHLKFAQGKTSFPCEMPKLSINDLSWESDTEWKYGIPEWRQEDGAVIFYRDDREELKPLTKEEQLEANNSQQEVSTSSNSYSYVSSYSPRKERALKIYLDTNSRRTRPVVDVD